MSLDAPKLDDRHFQDIVDEAKKRIPSYFDGWTDHNVSDPGITMIELFAWMTDMILYRLNQVPDRHYIKFMELLGMKLREPQPAQVPITFWLSQPQPVSVTIPAGTEVASTQTETEASIVFSTDVDLKITPPKLQAVVFKRQGQTEEGTSLHNLTKSGLLQAINAFSSRPHEEDAIYFGFENDLSQHILGFRFECEPRAGAHIKPGLPPYVWEAATTDEKQVWQKCVLDQDETKGLNESGRMRLHVPDLLKINLAGQNLYWVRLRPLSAQEINQVDGMTPYAASPRLFRVEANSWGGTVPATHAELMPMEPLGRSDGTPNQRFRLQSRPILPRKPTETLAVVSRDGREEERWTEVPHFANSGPGDKHFTLDGVTGEIRLGPAIREPHHQNGKHEIIYYGAFPPRESTLYFTGYRSGGGEEGNVQPGFLNTLKTAIPFVSQVENRFRAEGGVDTEDLEQAKMRAPRLLQARGRAVTEEDFEFLAKEAVKEDVGRIKCLQPQPSDDRVSAGSVFVLVIPKVVAEENGRIPPEQLKLSSAKRQAIKEYLDKRRLLTVRLDVQDPIYHWVSVRVRVRKVEMARRSDVEAQVKERLYTFLNPLVGGVSKQGWTFGRHLYIADIYPCLQGIEDVVAVERLELFDTNEAGVQRGKASVERVEVLAHGLIASSVHHVEVV